VEGLNMEENMRRADATRNFLLPDAMLVWLPLWRFFTERR